MTRLYIELKAAADASGKSPAGSHSTDPDTTSQDSIMRLAQLMCALYTLEWEMVDRFGHYKVRSDSPMTA